MEFARKVVGIAIICSLVICSCSEQKYFLRSNHFQTLKPRSQTEIGDPTVTYDTLFNFKPKQGFWAKMKEKDSYVIITPNEKDSILSSAIKKNTFVIKQLPKEPNREQQLRASIEAVKNKIFFPDVVLDSFNYSNLKFFDLKPVFQTLTIPLRIRPAVKSAALKDSFPSQVETGVSLGIAFGGKFTLNYYKVKQNSFGQKGNEISVTPGVFYNIGSADLSTANTRNPVLSIERHALMHSLGGFVMLGFNTVNFGYAFGWDFATGPRNKSWVYQGKFWYGVAFALDLIK